MGHYENFPVASVLLPRRLRGPVRLIYAFARQADDFADEGDWTARERLSKLDAFRAELKRIETRRPPETPLFGELAEVIQRHRLPLPCFYDLLDAFSQDVTQKRYADFGEVMNYCRRSANPVGRLMLALYGAAGARNNAYSDGICSSLQLINFLQDVAIDWQKDRIYLPQDEMARFGVTEAQIQRGDADGHWSSLMLYQIQRARRMLLAGSPLARRLDGRIGLELRMVVLGGERILKKIQACGGDVFRRRPVLSGRDWLGMAWRAVASGGFPP